MLLYIINNHSLIIKGLFCQYFRFADIEEVDLDFDLNIDGEMHIDIPHVMSADSVTLAEQAEILDVWPLVVDTALVTKKLLPG